MLARAELHDDERDVLERVRRGTHVHIDWRVNLLQLMKRDFNQNGRCDFSIGAAPSGAVPRDRWLIY